VEGRKEGKPLREHRRGTSPVQKEEQTVKSEKNGEGKKQSEQIKKM
jgi:hypothetical protein